MRQPLRIGVLVSGSGTNLQAIIDAIEGGRLAAAVRIVICNAPDVPALDRARRHDIPWVVVDHRSFPTRESFDGRLVAELRARDVELVVLAGFTRLLSPVLIQAYPQRIMNIHPALLPSFPGLHGQRQALEYGVRIAGATVHFVDEQTDHGPVIIQAAVPVCADDTEETLRDRILRQEHRIFPEAIQLFAEGRLRVEGRRVRVIDGVVPPEAALASPVPR
jgi:phosphoribosylglycinamide formyltransferase-1